MKILAISACVGLYTWVVAARFMALGFRRGYVHGWTNASRGVPLTGDQSKSLLSRRRARTRK